MTQPAHRILCVCLGNICRSPTAEAVLRDRLPLAEVDSAGTSDWHVGDPPYAPAIKAASKRGYDLTPQRARQVSVGDFDDFDLILAMDAKNLEDLRTLMPAGSKARVHLFLEPVGGGDVPDPFYTRDFDGALDLIERAATAWAKSLT